MMPKNKHFLAKLDDVYCDLRFSQRFTISEKVYDFYYTRASKKQI